LEFAFKTAQFQLDPTFSFSLLFSFFVVLNAEIIKVHGNNSNLDKSFDFKSHLQVYQHSRLIKEHSLELMCVLITTGRMTHIVDKNSLCCWTDWFVLKDRKTSVLTEERDDEDHQGHDGLQLAVLRANPAES